MCLPGCSLSTAARKRFLRIVIALLVCVFLGGCVRRRMTIRSNPPGALVYIDDYEIGTTPISTNFTYYGERKIRLVKDGFETLTVMQPVRPPWYQYPVIDFFAENVVPGEIRDTRVLDFQMSPQMMVPTDQLLSRAEDLRRGGYPAGFTALSSPTTPVRINSVQPSVEHIPAPSPIGGQPTYPLPPSGGR
jgi:hypothetical protein